MVPFGIQTGNLSRIIDKIRDLPTLPILLLKVLDLINDPKTTANDLGRVISKDQVQTARLLKLVNSAFYDFPQQISSVPKAVAIVGLNAVRNLVLCTTVFHMFSDSGGAMQFERREFWKHSLGTAVGAKIIGKYAGSKCVEDLFTAGLLHDIGKVVEDRYLHEEFLTVLDMVHKYGMNMAQAEGEVIGCTHSQIGKLLAQKWKFPLNLQQGIAFHHHPEDAPKGHEQITAAVHLADILAHAMEIGWSANNKVPSLKKEAWEMLNLNLTIIETIMDEIEAEFIEVSSIFMDWIPERSFDHLNMKHP
jgi:putative nucleotidyltransferase with HDIG domain